MKKPTAWLEVMDPVTGLKVDVTVAFHTNWATPMATEHTNRIAREMVRLLEGRRDGVPVFPLSDMEEAE